MRSGRLAGYHPLLPPQVVDVGQVVAGNFCGALLAYFGASVIKVRAARGVCCAALCCAAEAVGLLLLFDAAPLLPCCCLVPLRPLRLGLLIGVCCPVHGLRLFRTPCNKQHMLLLTWPQVEPPGRGDALRHLRMADATGTSLWWRSYVRPLFSPYLTAGA